MIEKNTTFILGAGAHIPYGFPSGEGLKEQVVEYLKKNPDCLLWAPHYSDGLILASEVQRENCIKFANALGGSAQASIDNFMEANKGVDGFLTIGKAIIARILLDCESKQIRENPDIKNNLINNDLWLEYLVKQRMIEGVHSPDRFIENKISFVTFNYDRYLERRIYSYIKNSWVHLEENQALHLLNKIPIIHVYGSLGEFDPNQPYIDPQNTHPYSSAWMTALRGIKTIHEAQDNDSFVKQARKYIGESVTVCLLGFGYHKENIELLDLPRIFDNSPKPKIIASRFGVTDVERIRLNGHFLKNGKGREIFSDSIGQDMRCCETLRNNWL